MIVRATGRQFECELLGRRFRLLNQHSPEWSEPYPHPIDPDDTLQSAGCGIFSLCHAVEWMSGLRLRPEALAAFALAHGGREGDGTDRPKLLSALMETGEARVLGFRYEGDGLLNDAEPLFAHLIERRGAALANLRPGHIVCLLAARAQAGERQVLAVDSHPGPRPPFDAIRAVVSGTDITYPTVNAQGVTTGWCAQAAAFWAPLELARDFNLLHRI